METEEIDKRIELYIDILTKIRGKVSDEESVRAVLFQVGKDLRTPSMKGRDKNNPGSNADVPATPKQLALMKKLGVEAPEGLTKKECSKMLDERLDKKKDGEGGAPPPS